MSVEVPGFKRGDKVKRKAGSYEFPGYVLSQFQTTIGVWLVAVEHAKEVGMVHIFRASDLELRSPRS